MQEYNIIWSLPHLWFLRIVHGFPLFFGCATLRRVGIRRDGNPWHYEQCLINQPLIFLLLWCSIISFTDGIWWVVVRLVPRGDGKTRVSSIASTRIAGFIPSACSFCRPMSHPWRTSLGLVSYYSKLRFAIYSLKFPFWGNRFTFGMSVHGLKLLGQCRCLLIRI